MKLLPVCERHSLLLKIVCDSSSLECCARSCTVCQHNCVNDPSLVYRNGTVTFMHWESQQNESNFRVMKCVEVKHANSFLSRYFGSELFLFEISFRKLMVSLMLF
jgi:hypothetical protein